MSLFFVPNPNHEMANVGAPNGNLIIMKIVGFFSVNKHPWKLGLMTLQSAPLNSTTVSSINHLVRHFLLN